MGSRTDRAYSPKYAEALDYAVELHATQWRKSDPGTIETIPYAAHLLEVSSLVWLGGGTEAQAIAGLLHDALEDQGEHTSFEVISDRFGPDVAAIVQACTDSDPGQERDSSTWLGRKVPYLAHLYYPASPKAALLVTAADKISNARAILDDFADVGDVLWTRFNNPQQAIAWYYAEVLAAIEMRDPDNGLLPRLRPLVEQIAAIAGGTDLAAAMGLNADQLEHEIAALSDAKASLRA
jgi:(p)ppGpp synthase/HD superfamily hydrolase